MAPKKDAVKAAKGTKPVPKSTKAPAKAADAKKAPGSQVKKAQQAMKRWSRASSDLVSRRSGPPFSSSVPGPSVSPATPSTPGSPPPRGPTWTLTTSSSTRTPQSLPSRSSTRSKSSKSTPLSDPTARRRLTSDWLPTTTPWTLLTRLESSKHQNSFLLASYVLLSYGLNNIKFENH